MGNRPRVKKKVKQRPKATDHGDLSGLTRYQWIVFQDRMTFSNPKWRHFKLYFLLKSLITGRTQVEEVGLWADRTAGC